MIVLGQLNRVESVDPASGPKAGDCVARDDSSEPDFALIYEELLSVSDEPSSTSDGSNGMLDTGVEYDLLATLDSRARGIAISGSSKSTEYSSTGIFRDNEPRNDDLKPMQYSGSSMERLMSLSGDAPMRVERQPPETEPVTQQYRKNLQAAGSTGVSEIRPGIPETFDKSHLSTWMDAHALSRSEHHCAMYCRLGMEAAGINTGDRPQSGDAGDYGPFLLRHGAQTVPLNSYVPQVGDVVVFDKTDRHPHGHIEMYDGQHWVSDFMQQSFSPYHDASTTPHFTIYRLA